MALSPKDFMDLPKIQFNFSDLLVDFLGCLIPGFVALSFLSLIFSLPAIISYEIHPFDIELITSIFNKVFGLVITFFLLMAYVIGHLFYRLDPKRPDKESYWHVRDQLRNSGPFKEIFIDKKYNNCSDINKDYDHYFLTKREIIRANINIINHKKELKVEYPYDFLPNYLAERGFTELAEMVPWSSCSHNNRTKHFINSLKIRISVNAPNYYGPIARNEAHIRLMSSLWYMMKTLQKATYFSIAFILIVLAKNIFLNSMSTSNLATLKCLMMDYFEILLMTPILLFGVYSYIIRKINQFFHYMRIREVVYVLETTHFIHKNPKGLFIHENPKNDFM